MVNNNNYYIRGLRQSLVLFSVILMHYYYIRGLRQSFVLFSVIPMHYYYIRGLRQSLVLFSVIPMHYYYIRGLRQSLISAKTLQRPKYKEPFSMDYMEQESHARGRCVICISGRIPCEWEHQG